MFSHDDAAQLSADRALFGGLLEGFVAMEINKQLGWTGTATSLYHFRTHEGDEVIPFGPRLHAVPVEALWRWGARPVAS